MLDKRLLKHLWVQSSRRYGKNLKNAYYNLRMQVFSCKNYPPGAFVHTLYRFCTGQKIGKSTLDVDFCTVLL